MYVQFATVCMDVLREVDALKNENDGHKNAGLEMTDQMTGNEIAGLQDIKVDMKLAQKRQ